MCLIFVAWRAHPRYRLAVAANRDEFHARPTAPAAVWSGCGREGAAAAPGEEGTTAAEGGGGNGGADRPAGAGRPARRPSLLAGRDLSAGGTWLGVAADGRFAALTNWRSAPPSRRTRSRGQLVVDYLRGGLGAREQAGRVAREAGRYSGFNLLLADRDELFWISNRREEAVVRVPPGCHGLGNDRLNAPWPKVTGGLADFRRRMQDGFERDDLFLLLADDEPAAELPAGGLERSHSARFVRGESYGTRSSTVLCVEHEGAIAFEERSFDPSAAETGRVAFVRAAGGAADFTPAAAGGTGKGREE